MLVINSIYISYSLLFNVGLFRIVCSIYVSGFYSFVDDFNLAVRYD